MGLSSPLAVDALGLAFFDCSSADLFNPHHSAGLSGEFTPIVCLGLSPPSTQSLIRHPVTLNWNSDVHSKARESPTIAARTIFRFAGSIFSSASVFLILIDRFLAQSFAAQRSLYARFWKCLSNCPQSDPGLHANCSADHETCLQHSDWQSVRTL